MDPQALYDAVQTPLGLRTLLILNEICEPKRLAPLPATGEVGSRLISGLLERQQRPTERIAA